jgi:hypothetical protein
VSDTLSNYGDIYEANFVNGSYDVTSNSYTFNITQCIQDLIKRRKTDLKLILFSQNSNFSAFGVILKNTTLSNKIKLKIIYSKF